MFTNEKTGENYPKMKKVSETWTRKQEKSRIRRIK